MQNDFIFYQLFDSESSTYTYLIADKKSKEAGKQIKDGSQKLQDMQALKGMVDKARGTAKGGQDVTPAPTEGQDGYKNDQRQKLDSLIQTNQ